MAKLASARAALAQSLTEAEARLENVVSILLTQRARKSVIGFMVCQIPNAKLLWLWRSLMVTGK
jgi:hypothetical protein